MKQEQKATQRLASCKEQETAQPSGRRLLVPTQWTVKKQAKQKKRPLNGPSLAKNIRQVVNVDNDEDEPELFMTRGTPPKKKHKKNRTPSPEQPAAVTTSYKKKSKHKEQVPEGKGAVTKSKKQKEQKKNKDKYNEGLTKLISDQDEVLRQLAKGNQK